MVGVDEGSGESNLVYFPMSKSTRRVIVGTDLFQAGCVGDCGRAIAVVMLGGGLEVVELIVRNVLRWVAACENQGPYLH